MEEEPSFRVSFPNGEFEATRDNTSLFRFFGRLALYDHIYFVRDVENNQGTYLFSPHPAFEEAAAYMEENQYPAYINLREVAQCDQDAFDAMIHKDATSELEDGVPDDWN